MTVVTELRNARLHDSPLAAMDHFLPAWCTIVRWNVTPKHLTVLEDFSTSTGSVSRPGSVLFVFLRPCTKFATGLFFAFRRDAIIDGCLQITLSISSWQALVGKGNYCFQPPLIFWYRIGSEAFEGPHG